MSSFLWRHDWLRNVVEKKRSFVLMNQRLCLTDVHYMLTPSSLTGERIITSASSQNKTFREHHSNLEKQLFPCLIVTTTRYWAILTETNEKWDFEGKHISHHLIITIKRNSKLSCHLVHSFRSLCDVAAPSSTSRTRCAKLRLHTVSLAFLSTGDTWTIISVFESPPGEMRKNC